MPTSRHGAWQLWRMPDIEARQPGPSGSTRGATTSKVVEAEKRQAIKAAREEAYAKGLDAGHAEGLSKGMEEGRAVGLKEFETKRAELVTPLTQLAINMHSALRRVESDVGDALIEVALEVGKKIAGDALKTDPEMVKSLVRRLVDERLHLGTPVTLLMNPDDVAASGTEFAARMLECGWTLRADPSLERGGCRVVGPMGDVDASVETRVALVTRGIATGSAEPAGEQ